MQNGGLNFLTFAGTLSLNVSCRMVLESAKLLLQTAAKHPHKTALDASVGNIFQNNIPQSPLGYGQPQEGKDQSSHGMHRVCCASQLELHCFKTLLLIITQSVCIIDFM